MEDSSVEVQTQLQVQVHREPPIHRLPDHVISEIFKFTLPDWTFEVAYTEPEWYFPTVLTTAVQLGHISGRFRAIALDTPQLWLTISTTYPLTAARTCIDRARSAPLRIHVGNPKLQRNGAPPTLEHIGRIVQISKEILRKVSQWKELIVWGTGVWRYVSLLLLDHVGPGRKDTFEQLQKLSFHSPYEEDISMWHDISPAHADNTQKGRPDAQILPNNQRVRDFTVTGLHYGICMTIKELQGLTRFTALERLSLHGDMRYSQRLDAENSQQTLSFPKLSALELYIAVSCVDHHFNLLACMHLPTLKTFHLTFKEELLDQKPIGALEEFTSALLNSAEARRTLQSLHLFSFEYEVPFGTDPNLSRVLPADLFCATPHLRSISLAGRHLLPPECAEETHRISRMPLQRLEFREMAVTPTYLSALVGALQKGPCWETLRALHLRACWKIEGPDIPELSSKLEGRRLNWYPT